MKDLHGLSLALQILRKERRNARKRLRYLKNSSVSSTNSWGRYCVKSDEEIQDIGSLSYVIEFLELKIKE